MAEQKVIISEFSGGISPYDKVGVKSSAKFMRFLNPHEDPYKLTLAPAPAKVSGSIVVDLIKDGVDTRPYATDRYFYDLSGNIYKETSGGTWSVDRSGATIANGAAGQGMAVFDNFVYYATSTTIGRYGYLNNSPAYADDFLTDGTTNIDQSSTTTGSTYTLPTAISETATNRRSFVPTRDPLKAVQISINTVGAQTWTMTLHDSNNNSLGTVSVASGSLGTGFQTFTFTTPIRLTIGNTYHVHFTVPSGTARIDTSTASDLSTGAYKTVFGILIADTDYHPMLEHLNYLVTGNANYLATWDRALYNPNKISLKPGFTVRCLTKWKEYIVAGAVQDNTVDSLSECRLYYWDGIQTTFNFFDVVPFGLINSICNMSNTLFGVYGDQGTIYLGNSPFQEVQDAPRLARGKKLEVYPQATAVWQDKVVIGYSGVTDDSSFEQGIYEYGAKNDQFPNVMNYLFKISTGTSQATTVKIGMIKAFGKDLYFSWRDNTTYGMDKVTRGNNATTNTGSWESLIFDNGLPSKTKYAIKLIATYETLTTGQTVTPKYKINRATSFTSGTAGASTDTDPTRVELEIDASFREIEFGIDVASSSGTYPTITNITFSFEDKAGETFET